ncbi:MAG: hypothetical protein CMJ24_02410 [Phycisphaerae bacterium]|nr:hypothetical protein [Phycisphaerae bacterium]|tara:strand:+ start:3814 stop:5403 length:1590 start_codon:yes stop_codon:yes gene_type:complete
MQVMTRPDYMVSDLQIIADVIRVNDDQEPIVSLIFEDYDSAFTEAIELLYMSLGDIDSSRPEPTEEMRAQQEVMREQMRGLRDSSREIRREMSQLRREIETEGGEVEGDDRMAQLQIEMEDARDQMRQGIDGFRAQRAEFESTDEMKELSALGLSVLRTFMADKLALRIGLEEELQAVLTEEQITRLPKLVRVLRRDKQLRHGRISGESVNLFDVLRDMRPEFDPETEGMIDEMLLSYDVDLDVALISRQLNDESTMLRLYEVMESREYENAMKILERRHTLHQGVRDVNDQYIEVMAGLLPYEVAMEFRKSALESGYPDVFRRSRVTRAIDRAREIEGISPEMLEAINSIEIAYDGASQPLLERMLVAIRENERPRELEYIERRVNNDWSWGRRGEDEDDPVRMIQVERREVDEVYMDRLEALLGEEQFEAIAGRGGRSEGRGAMGGDFDREQMMARFDTNGDGELSEEERVALVREMRSRFGNDRPDGGRGRGDGGPGGRGGRGGRGGDGGGQRGGGGGQRGGGDRP